MTELGLLEEEGGNVQLTLLGRACGRSSLSFRSVLRLVELLRQVGPDSLTPRLLMAIVQTLPEADAAYTPVYKKGQKESMRVRQAAERFGSGVVSLLQRYAPDSWAYYGRCKRVAILFDWIGGVAVENLERSYSTTPYQGSIGSGDVTRFADVTRFHLRSASEIARVMYPGQGPDEATMEALLRQLETGMPAEALPLLELPLVLTRGEYLGFLRAGVSTPSALWELPETRLQEIVGTRRAHQLEQVRPKTEQAA